MKLDPVVEAARNPDRYLSGYPLMLMDADTAIVTQRDFARLDDYSASIPTGVCVGKVWKRGGPIVEDGQKVGERWVLGQFEEDPTEPDKYCLTTWRELLVA